MTCGSLPAEFVMTMQNNGNFYRYGTLIFSYIVVYVFKTN